MKINYLLRFVIGSVKKQLILSSLLVLPLFANAQIVNIPDAIFKVYLVGNASINTNLDVEIQVTEASVFVGATKNLVLFDLTVS